MAISFPFVTYFSTISAVLFHAIRLCIVGFSQSVDYDIEFIGGIRNTIFGGEGLFFATLRGSGTVYIQSLPYSRLAGRVLAMAPQTGKGNRGEGSILGGIGDLLDGDNRF